MRIPTKICGITTVEDARYADQYGAWALGFNFVPSSPRYITPDHAKQIADQLAETTLKIGVFVNAVPSDILSLMDHVRLDYAQVYEDIDIDLLLKSRMIISIKPRTMKDVPPLSILKQYAYVLIDAPRIPHAPMGGTGKLAIWPIAQELAREVRLILAGGLHPGNIQEAIRTVRPFGVDVASGIESSPGIKDHTLLSTFLRNTHDTY